jgi:hypothetical protein
VSDYNQCLCSSATVVTLTDGGRSNGVDVAPCVGYADFLVQSQLVAGVLAIRARGSGDTVDAGGRWTVE